MIYIKLKHLGDKFVFLHDTIRYVIAKLLLPVVRRQAAYRHLWIIAERGTDAKDNAYHLFAYIRRTHPEINIRYIITKNSPDYEKVAALGKTIRFRSFSHMLALVASEVKISTHIMGYTPQMYFFKLLDERYPMSGKKIYLQHGIIKDALPYDYANENHLDLFVCSAKREWEFVDSTFGYEPGIVRLLGACRYDSLPLPGKRDISRMIFLMPTWRFYLDELSSREFKKSRYYAVYDKLLNSRELEELLAGNGYRLVFCAHPNMLRYADCFTSDCPSVSVVRADQIDIQEYLIRTDLLITDYSSVYFDVAFMGKPVIYYQFDREEFFTKHYQQGYFSYYEDGFGPVFTEEGEILSYLKTRIAAGMIPEENYMERANHFFTFCDHDNCRRNYEAICDCLRSEKDDSEEKEGGL